MPRYFMFLGQKKMCENYQKKIMASLKGKDINAQEKRINVKLSQKSLPSKL